MRAKGVSRLRVSACADRQGYGEVNSRRPCLAGTQRERSWGMLAALSRACGGAWPWDRGRSSRSHAHCETLARRVGREGGQRQGKTVGARHCPLSVGRGKHGGVRIRIRGKRDERLARDTHPHQAPRPREGGRDDRAATGDMRSLGLAAGMGPEWSGTSSGHGCLQRPKHCTNGATERA